MIKEELEKEAYKWLVDNLHSTEEDYKRAYLAGAEPREKRIAELEKENAELKKKKEEIEIMTEFCKTCKQMHTDQLTKAKGIIKIMKHLLFDVWGYIDIPFEERVNKFLSEVGK